MVSTVTVADVLGDGESVLVPLLPPARSYVRRVVAGTAEVRAAQMTARSSGDSVPELPAAYLTGRWLMAGGS